MAGTKLNKDSKDNDKKKVAKPSAYRFTKKSKTETDKTKKLVDGGAVIENVSCRLISYDIHGSNESGFWVNQILKSESVIDFPKGATNDKIIGVLKEKGILTDKANTNNITIEGEQDLTLFFSDSDLGMPLFELQNVENYEKKSNGGNLSGSPLLKEEYFKTTAPVQNSVDTSATVNTTVEQPVVIDGKEVVGIDTGVNTEVKTDVNPSGNLVLPDYDNNSQESIVNQHMSGNEIHVSHLQQILGRITKYEEIIGTIRLRKCFIRPYYKKF